MITVFTPTYNRAYILPNLYESLCNQTNFDFEWIIVDDDSDDNTKDLVKIWIEDNIKFKIRYFKQERGGKHRAINLGVRKAIGDWFFIVDSDDYITENAINNIIKWTNGKLLNNIAAVSGTRIYPNGNIIGGFPELHNLKYIDVCNTDRKKHNLSGDKAEVYKTSVLKKFPFQEFEGEYFLSEATVWNEISNKGYLIRWYKDPLIVCEYLEDGLTRQDPKSRILNNYNGFRYLQLQTINYFTGIEKFKAKSSYIYYSKLKGVSNRELIKDLKCSSIYIELILRLFNFLKILKRVL